MLLFLYVLSQCVIKQADKCNKLSQLMDNFMSGHRKVTIQCYCFVSDSHVYNCYSHVIREEGFHILYCTCAWFFCSLQTCGGFKS